MEDVKILQIMPAEGWVAVYDGGDEGEMEEPLACFALVQVDYKNGDGIQTEVRGMAPDEKLMAFVEDATNFRRFAALKKPTTKRKTRRGRVGFPRQALAGLNGRGQLPALRRNFPA